MGDVLTQTGGCKIKNTVSHILPDQAYALFYDNYQLWVWRYSVDIATIAVIVQRVSFLLTLGELLQLHQLLKYNNCSSCSCYLK